MTDLNTLFGELRSKLQHPIITREKRGELIDFLKAARLRNQTQYDEIWAPYLLSQDWFEPFWEVSSRHELEVLAQVVCGARFQLDLSYWEYSTENVHALQRLADTPDLRWICGLSFHGANLPSKSLQILLDSPHLHELKALDLAYCRNLRSLEPIVTSTNLTALKTLHLDKVTSLPKETINALGTTQALPNLTTLILTEMYIARTVIEHIKANPHLSKLEKIEVSPKKIYG